MADEPCRVPTAECLLWLAGAEKVFPLGDLSDYEKEGLKAAIPELKASIDKGVEFGKADQAPA